MPSAGPHVWGTGRHGPAFAACPASHGPCPGGGSCPWPNPGSPGRGCESTPGPRRGCRDGSRAAESGLPSPLLHHRSPGNGRLTPGAAAPLSAPRPPGLLTGRHGNRTVPKYNPGRWAGNPTALPGLQESWESVASSGRAGSKLERERAGPSFPGETPRGLRTARGTLGGRAMEGGALCSGRGPPHGASSPSEAGRAEGGSPSALSLSSGALTTEAAERTLSCTFVTPGPGTPFGPVP